MSFKTDEQFKAYLLSIKDNLNKNFPMNDNKAVKDAYNEWKGK